jgi:DNA-binding LacI/PurR family transcriptional regulator
MVEQDLVPGRRVTVRDVARAAGVSPATVSNTISGKRRVDAETRVRIEAAIHNLGYVPNVAARRMRTGRANAIALFSSMPVSVAAGASKLGFLMEIAASAAVTALELNTALVLVPPIDDPTRALDTISVDGALVVEPERDDPVLRQLKRWGIPCVCIGRAPGQDLPCVDLDYSGMAELLFRHLWDCGARRFPLVVGTSARASHEAFRDIYARRAADVEMDPVVIEVPELDAERGAAKALSEAFARGAEFDGLLVPIDAMATGAMRALRGAGLSVPGDVRVVTRYDGLRARSEVPALTALNLHLDAVAEAATRALASQIDGEAFDFRLAAPAPGLIVRGSSWTE